MPYSVEVRGLISASSATDTARPNRVGICAPSYSLLAIASRRQSAIGGSSGLPNWLGIWLANYQQAVALAGAQLGPLAEQTLALDDFWQLNQAQWMWLLRQNLGSVDTMSQLVAVYEGYHSQLAPLMGRIERTDWLIDQIVYQLYGLTEEEIAVVEGRSL